MKKIVVINTALMLITAIVAIALMLITVYLGN